MKDDGVIFHEDEDMIGISFKDGIDSVLLINMIEEIDG